MFIKSSKGFTLIELLVVISIVGLLSSIVLASLNTARDKGRVASGQQAQASIHRAYGSDAIMYFDFDGNTISTVKDSLGNNYGPLNWSSSGCSIDTSRSPDSGGSSFNCSSFGSNMSEIYFNSQDAAFFTQAGISYTVAGWFRPTSAVSANTFLFGLTWNNFLYFDSSNRLIVEMRSNATSPSSIMAQNSIYSDFFMSLNKWYFIAMTVDTVGLKVSLYVDGKLISTVPMTGSYISAYPGFFIGPYPTAYSGGGRLFNGNIDKVGLYKKALGTAQIQNMYLVDKEYFLAKVN